MKIRTIVIEPKYEIKDLSQRHFDLILEGLVCFSEASYGPQKGEIDRVIRDLRAKQIK